MLRPEVHGVPTSDTFKSEVGDLDVTQNPHLVDTFDQGVQESCSGSSFFPGFVPSHFSSHYGVVEEAELTTRTWWRDHTTCLFEKWVGDSFLKREVFIFIEFLRNRVVDLLRAFDRSGFFQHAHHHPSHELGALKLVLNRIKSSDVLLVVFERFAQSFAIGQGD